MIAFAGSAKGRLTPYNPSVAVPRGSQLKSESNSASMASVGEWILGTRHLPRVTGPELTPIAWFA